MITILIQQAFLKLSWKSEFFILTKNSHCCGCFFVGANTLQKDWIGSLSWQTEIPVNDKRPTENHYFSRFAVGVFRKNWQISPTLFAVINGRLAHRAYLCHKLLWWKIRACFPWPKNKCVIFYAIATYLLWKLVKFRLLSKLWSLAPVLLRRLKF